MLEVEMPQVSHLRTVWENSVAAVRRTAVDVLRSRSSAAIGAAADRYTSNDVPSALVLTPTVLLQGDSIGFLWSEARRLVWVCQEGTAGCAPPLGESELRPL